MKRNKYINSFNTTAEYDNYIESAYPEFPNVGLTKDDGELHYRITSPNDYQIWGTTTATENFNTGLGECVVDPQLGEFYIQGYTGTLTSLQTAFFDLSHITSIKKFDLDTSNVTTMRQMFDNCTSLTSINLSGCNTSNVTNMGWVFSDCTSLTSLDLSNWDTSNAGIYEMFKDCNSLTDIYINVEVTLMKLTNNLSSQGTNYIPSSATIHYNGTDYKWQNNAWTPQSV